MTHRLTYIDTTRAILITLVVLEHVLNYANPQYNIIPYTLAQEWIGAFHMPAFFVLSGLLTDGEKWRGRSAGAYFVHKARTLLIPYLFFECLALLYKHFVLHSVSFAEGLRLMLTMHCNVSADWFLPAMFLACVLYYLYIRFPRKIAWGVGGTVLLLGLRFLMSTRGGHLQALLFRGILGFVFMLAGNLLKKQLMAFSWPKIGGAFFLTAGFCFWGTTILNIWFSFAGVLVYCLAMKKKPGAMANAFLFSTGLAPLITEMLFRYPGEAWHGFTGLGIVLALAVGIFIGFIGNLMLHANRDKNTFILMIVFCFRS